MPDHLDVARHYLHHAQEAADTLEKTRGKQNMTPVGLEHGLQMATAYALLSIAESLAAAHQFESIPIRYPK